MGQQARSWVARWRWWFRRKERIWTGQAPVISSGLDPDGPVAKLGTVLVSKPAMKGER